MDSYFNTANSYCRLEYKGLLHLKPHLIYVKFFLLGINSTRHPTCFLIKYYDYIAKNLKNVATKFC